MPWAAAGGPAIAALARAYMTHPLPDVSAFTQPPPEFIDEVEGIGIRSTILEKKWHCVGQHAHLEAHATFVGSGAVRLWADGQYVGDFLRGQAIGVKAGAAHIFQALEDDTLLACLTVVKEI
jgi:hypothetical protein